MIYLSCNIKCIDKLERNMKKNEDTNYVKNVGSKIFSLKRISSHIKTS